MIDRDLMEALSTERVTRVYGQCVYCGDPCHGIACRSHRDLLAHDPNHYELRLRTRDEQATETNAPSRTSTTGARPGTST